MKLASVSRPTQAMFDGERHGQGPQRTDERPSARARRPQDLDDHGGQQRLHERAQHDERRGSRRTRSCSPNTLSTASSRSSCRPVGRRARSRHRERPLVPEREQRQPLQDHDDQDRARAPACGDDATVTGHGDARPGSRASRVDPAPAARRSNRAAHAAEGRTPLRPRGRRRPVAAWGASCSCWSRLVLGILGIVRLDLAVGVLGAAMSSRGRASSSGNAGPIRPGQHPPANQHEAGDHDGGQGERSHHAARGPGWWVRPPAPARPSSSCAKATNPACVPDTHGDTRSPATANARRAAPSPGVAPHEVAGRDASSATRAAIDRGDQDVIAHGDRRRAEHPFIQRELPHAFARSRRSIR